METDMGKRKQKEEEKKEKPIFGSGAEPQPEPKDDGLVKCVCTVPCAWRGYHDEGDRVFVDRELLASDPFFKVHFKAADGARPDAEQDGEAQGENAEGEDEKDENADGESENAEGEDENAGGENENAGGDGRGELGLK